MSRSSRTRLTVSHARMGFGGSAHREPLWVLPAVVLCWLSLVLNVQPWLSTTSDAATPKATALLATLLLSILIYPKYASVNWPRGSGLLCVYACFFAWQALQASEWQGPLLRMGRLLLALVILLLLWPHFRRHSLLMLVAHGSALAVLASVVLVGAVVQPAKAWLSDGSAATEGIRLVGTLLPLPANRVGETGALLAGLCLLTLAYRRMSWGPALIGVAIGSLCLFGSRTRTAVFVGAFALLVSFVANRRTDGGRRGLYGFAVLGGIAMLGGSVVLNWLTRSQDSRLLLTLTGRTHTWTQLLSQPLTPVEFLFGHGSGAKTVLIRRSDNTFGDMPIDSSYLAAYWEGGVAALVFLLIFLATLAHAVVRTRAGLARSAAVFLLTYAVVSGITETGLGDLSFLTVHLLVVCALAASNSETMLVPSKSHIPATRI